MHSVDLAFMKFVNRHGLRGSYSFYCLPDVEDDVIRIADLPFRYHNLHEKVRHISESDVIVFWGDFLHSRRYLDEIRQRLAKTDPNKTTGDLLDVAYRAFLLENIDLNEVGTVVFGGSLMNLDSSSYSDVRYVTSLLNVYRKASLVLTRDVQSAMVVNHLMGNYKDNYCGVDCAFLLHDESAAELYARTFSKTGNDMQVGIFFGRSWYYESYFDFSLKVCEGLGARAVWIPWFCDTPSSLIEKYDSVMDFGMEEGGLEAMFDALKACSLVISDTYHCCINAWALGVPAVCIGRGVGSMKYSIDDKKKEVLYGMIGASDLYVYAEIILGSRLPKEIVLAYSRESDVVQSICNAVNSSSQMRKIFERIDGARWSAERRLLDVVTTDVV